jgi:F0F1-type ATP synthase assembly protein I
LETNHNSQKPNSKKKVTKTALRFAGLGTTLAASIALGAFGGKKLDDYLGTDKPLCTAAGALLGLGIGMWSVLSGIQSK